MNADTAAVFAYGTLEIPEVVRAVTGSFYTGRPAWLPGFARALLRGHTYPGIVPAPGERVAGVVYAGVDRATLRQLDAFEGAQYERRLLEVWLDSDVRIGAHTYVVRPEHAALLSAEPWDRARFVADHLDAFLRVCEAFRADPSGGGV